MKRLVSVDPDMTRLTPTAMARLVLDWFERLTDPLDVRHYDFKLSESDIDDALNYGRD